jgi:hypothetical protein
VEEISIPNVSNGTKALNVKEIENPNHIGYLFTM